MKKQEKALSCLALFVFCCLLLSAVPASASPLVIPASRKTVEAGAYRGDSSIDTVILEEGVEFIGSGAFAASGVREITLPASLTFIAGDAFDGTSLQTVHAPKGSYAYSRMRDLGYIVEYRALLIGEQSFLWFSDEDDPDSGLFLDNMEQRNVADVLRMSETLEHVLGPLEPLGPSGGAFQLTRKTNLSWSGIRDAIADTFADTRDQDLSVFFVATHGNDAGDGDLRTAFTGDSFDPDQVRAYWEHRYLSFRTLASWLTAHVRGRVFVILESCGSGSSVYSNSSRPGLRKAPSQSVPATDGFADRAVSVFAAEDPGLSPAPSGKEIRLFSNSTGDLRLPKYYVLAASRHHEPSYGFETYEEDTSYNFFTKWLIEGIGTKDRSPADRNRDYFLSLDEMYRYVSQFSSFEYEGVTYYQHVQRYPENNHDKLLKLNRPEPVSYTVTDIQGGTHTVGSGKDTVITLVRSPAETARDRFAAVDVDGEPADASCYSVSEDGLVLTLKSAFLDTLAPGKHTITIRFSDGEAETTFLVKKAAPAPSLDPTKVPSPEPTVTPAPEPTSSPRRIPKTGDHENPAALLLVLGSSLAALLVLGKFRSR